MDSTTISDRLEAGLSLERPAVALAFVDGFPESIPLFSGAPPSACSFWRAAETGTFYAPATSHRNCPLGAMVMGFALEKPLQEALSDSVDEMLDASYISADEVERIPTVTEDSAGIVYGPLREIPLEPDVVLLWLTPATAMLFGEAGGNLTWSESPGRVFGRPACAAIPAALQSGRPELSLGCVGMRTFTEVRGDQMLGVLPGAVVGPFVEELEKTLAANAHMAGAYQARRSAGGEEPVS